MLVAQQSDLELMHPITGTHSAVGPASSMVYPGSVQYPCNKLAPGPAYDGIAACGVVDLANSFAGATLTGTNVGEGMEDGVS